MERNDLITEVSLPTGFRISNRYEVVRYLGSGATGSVFVAIDRLLEDTTVAVKVLRMSAAKSHEQVKRFLREVKLMNSVNHPNVVRTFDAGSDRDLIYFTMEFIEGISLEEMAQRKELTFDQIRGIVVQIAAGLQAIHDAAIIHRDLKPGNIIVDAQLHVKIGDFGVARPVSSSLTQTGSILGSFDYMAPEVWEGLEPSPSVDLYSLGIVLYELAVGHPPFYSAIPAQIMRMHLNDLPIPPVSLRDDVPDWLNSLILRLLEKSPSRRLKSAREVRDAAERAAVPVPQLLPDPEPIPLPMEHYAPAVVNRPQTDEPEDENSVTSESACDAIIFKSFPTNEEIQRHEQRVMQHGLRGGSEEAALQAKQLRRLEILARIIGLGVLGVAVIIAAFILRGSELGKKGGQSAGGDSRSSGFHPPGLPSFLSWGGGDSSQGASTGDRVPIPLGGNGGTSGHRVDDYPTSSHNAGGEAVFRVGNLLDILRDEPRPSGSGSGPGGGSSGGSDSSRGGSNSSSGQGSSRGSAAPSSGRNGSGAHSESQAVDFPSGEDARSLVRFSDPSEFISRYPDYREAFDQVRLYDVSLLTERARTIESEAFQKRATERLAIELDLSLTEWRLGVAGRGITNEAATREVESELKGSENALRAASLLLSAEKLKYSRWFVLRDRLNGGDILGVGQVLSAADGIVASKKAAYDAEWARYNESVEQSKAHPEQQQLARTMHERGEALEQRSAELRDAIWSVVEGGTKRQLAALVQFAGVVDILKRERDEFRGRLELVRRIAASEERRMTIEELKNRRDAQTSSLALLSSQMSVADLRAARVSQLLSSNDI